MFLHGLPVQLQTSLLCVRHPEGKGLEKPKIQFVLTLGPGVLQYLFSRLPKLHGKEPVWFSYMEGQYLTYCGKGLEGNRKPSLGANNLAFEYPHELKSSAGGKGTGKPGTFIPLLALFLTFTPCPVLSLISGLHLRELTRGANDPKVSVT